MGETHNTRFFAWMVCFVLIGQGNTYLHICLPTRRCNPMYRQAAQENLCVSTKLQLTHIVPKVLFEQDCIPVGCVPPACWPYLPACSASEGCTWSGEGVYLVWGVYLVPEGCTWSQGGVPGSRGVYLVLGDVPSPGGCTWSWGVYLVLGVSPPGGCTWSQWGCTWSQGVYLVLSGGCTWSGGVSAPGGCTCSWGCTWSQGGVCSGGVYLDPGGAPGLGGGVSVSAPGLGGRYSPLLTEWQTPVKT